MITRTLTRTATALAVACISLTAPGTAVVSQTETVGDQASRGLLGRI